MHLCILTASAINQLALIKKKKYNKYVYNNILTLIDINKIISIIWLI